MSTLVHTIISKRVSSTTIDLNASEPTTTITPITTDFFTTLEVNQCLIGSKCSKTKNCCPNGIEESFNGVSCYKHKKHHSHGHGKKKSYNSWHKKGICCINDGYVGCLSNDDCCGHKLICDDGVCSNRNECFIGSLCTKTEDCCSGFINDRINGITCSCQYKDSSFWSNGNVKDKACCIKSKYDGCSEDTDCCGKHSACIDGICKNRKYKGHFALFDFETGDDSILASFDIDSKGVSVSLLLVIVGVLICLTLIIGTCCLYMIMYTKKKEVRDELSTVSSIVDWESVRSEIPLKPWSDWSNDEDDVVEMPFKPNKLFSCFCKPRKYAYTD